VSRRPFYCLDQRLALDGINPAIGLPDERGHDYEGLS
jgi:hypothetical protein